MVQVELVDHSLMFINVKDYKCTKSYIYHNEERIVLQHITDGHEIEVTINGYLSFADKRDSRKRLINS